MTGADPTLLGLDTFAELERPIDLERTFRSEEYVAWNAMRRLDDARFLALTLPRVLGRRAHGDDPTREDGFRYEAALDVDGVDVKTMLQEAKSTAAMSGTLKAETSFEGTGPLPTMKAQGSAQVGQGFGRVRLTLGYGPRRGDRLSDQIRQLPDQIPDVALEQLAVAPRSGHQGDPQGHRGDDQQGEE